MKGSVLKQWLIFSPMAVALSTVLLVGASASPASPPLVEVAGMEDGSVPIQSYYGHLVHGVDQPGVLMGINFPLESKLKPGDLSLKDRTSAGQVFSRQWMTHPIFVVGSDALSQRWLQKHLQSLIQLKAEGLVVQAQSEAEFKMVQKLAIGVNLTPVRDKWLEQKLLRSGIKTYPLLVTENGRLAHAPNTQREVMP